MSLSFVDLFAGCGGFSLGLEKAGLKGVLHLEMDEWACETLKANFDKDVKINSTVDENLIGGMIIKVGSRMIMVRLHILYRLLQKLMKLDIGSAKRLVGVLRTID